ncbi:PGF-CTERM protein [Halomicrobium zhouii]|uniref:PGF-CTERM protein n=1 Tax=Halomicrobium zhouii TaxID=767519 RepID=A0A1I6LVA2_9EURY|nr:PGF-CTERM sorting domain-containing protein [Halomicrobium zhouii]SFS07344.1 PGF-CTERM protein [Halomicrobium zhouii]
MQRETAFVGGLAVVLLAMLVGVTAVPGVVAEPREDVRPSHFVIQDDQWSIQPVDVSGRTATLQVETRIRHWGGVGENVTVAVRAVDSKSGLLEDRTETDLGAIEGERETPVRTNLTVARQGGYHVETFVFEDSVTEAEHRRSISGVEALKPAYARSPVEFHDYGGGESGKPTIDKRIEAVEDGTATLELTPHLTNQGDDTAGDVTLVVTARQADSHVVAGQAQTDVGSIRPGRTARPTVELTVPEEYNYWLDATLLKDGVVVDTISEPANLDPQETLEEDERQTEVTFDAGDFTGTERDHSQDRSSETPTGSSGPGFGTAIALVGLVGAALLAARRNQ